MYERYEIRLAGSGGQGLVLAGVILGEAASVYENLYAVQSQSYGPEARGGASKSEVIIGTQAVSYPKATCPDLLLALTQESYDKYAKATRKGGYIVYDSEAVEPKPEGEWKQIGLPMVELARKEIGREMVVNIIALGVIQELTKVVTLDALKKAVANRVPKGTEAINHKALQVGIDALIRHDPR